jgi:hypothetical protein
MHIFSLSHQLAKAFSKVTLRMTSAAPQVDAILIPSPYPRVHLVIHHPGLVFCQRYEAFVREWMSNASSMIWAQRTLSAFWDSGQMIVFHLPIIVQVITHHLWRTTQRQWQHPCRYMRIHLCWQARIVLQSVSMADVVSVMWEVLAPSGNRVNPVKHLNLLHSIFSIHLSQASGNFLGWNPILQKETNDMLLLQHLKKFHFQSVHVEIMCLDLLMDFKFEIW